MSGRSVVILFCSARSCSMALSITRSAVREPPAGGTEGVWTARISEPANTTATTVIKMDFNFIRCPSSISQLKSDMHDSRRINGLADSLSRLEPDLFGCPNGVFIQAVSQSVNDFHDTHFAGRCKQDSHQDFTFDVHLPGFVGVLRTRF